MLLFRQNVRECALEWQLKWFWFSKITMIIYTLVDYQLLIFLPWSFDSWVIELWIYPNQYEKNRGPQWQPEFSQKIILFNLTMLILDLNFEILSMYQCIFFFWTCCKMWFPFSLSWNAYLNQCSLESFPVDCSLEEGQYEQVCPKVLVKM